ncbi:MAG: hypothetical protein KME32_13335 [Mojavia pulchra JT2-VF2]|jgi:hypothetical protein|uniref:Uncharacterized protein n=1 Tax=Mojavia pulchra JT2-VF2 TaxID=287848 RepID=A0A951UG07_9NOST|nr:hypothetical protein [Mojavia pulchra JT2-VF2]
MKSSPLALVVVIGTLAMTQSAYANQKNFPSATGEVHQAAILVTKPATLTSKWGNSINSINNFKATANSITVVQEQGCKNINPLEFIKNPEAIFKQCQKQTNNPTPQLAEPIEYLKVPRLDSGIKVTVGKF